MPATSLDQQRTPEGLLDLQALKAAGQQAWEAAQTSPFLAPAGDGSYVDDEAFQLEKQRQYEAWLQNHEEPTGRDVPPNSDCANATLIGPGIYAFNTTEARFTVPNRARTEYLSTRIWHLGKNAQQSRILLKKQ